VLSPKFDEAGLVPCIVQDADRGAVLMMAWMNAEALELTRATGIVHFWSRSRGTLWKKGETSGNTLALVELRGDCDRDCLLARVRAAGPACHTGTPTCFFDHDDGSTDDGIGAPTVLERLDATLIARRDSATAEKSYTKSLLAAGVAKIVSKIIEEAGELNAELLAGPDDKVIYEAADLLFHLMVGLTARGIPFTKIQAELARREGVSGHTEKMSRT